MSLIYKIQRVNSILMSLLSVCGVKSSSIPKRVLSIDHRKVLTAREPLSISFLNHSTNFMHRYFILLILLAVHFITVIITLGHWRRHCRAEKDFAITGYISQGERLRTERQTSSPHGPISVLWSTIRFCGYGVTAHSIPSTERTRQNPADLHRSTRYRSRTSHGKMRR